MSEPVQFVMNFFLKVLLLPVACRPEHVIVCTGTAWVMMTPQSHSIKRLQISLDKKLDVASYFTELSPHTLKCQNRENYPVIMQERPE
jgi:hypothetical protein